MTKKDKSKKSAVEIEPLVEVDEEDAVIVDGDLSSVPASVVLSPEDEIVVEDDEPAQLDPALGAAEVSGELVKYDPLQSYLAEIRNIPTLSREEEHALALRYHEKKDEVAGYKLVLANLRLVVMIAREYQQTFRNVLDLVQEGNIGLMEAVKNFDPYRGIRFPSYASYWVRAYMLRYLINNLRLVKIGTTQAQRKLFFNLRKEKERLEAEGFRPEAKLLAERLDVKESEVLEMEQRLALPDMSIDSPLSPNGDSGETTDLHGLLSDNKESAEERVVREQFAEAIRGAVQELELDEKERAIVDLRLLAEEPQTLQEIADRFALSRERIRQIENRLKDRLKKQLSEKLGLGETGEVIVSND